MASVLDTRVDPETGHELTYYESGVIYDNTAGHAISTAASTRITSETSRQMHQKRREKAAARIRASIGEVTTDVLSKPTSSMDAIGYAAGELWRDIVLNQEAKHRDRRETYIDILRVAGYYSPNDDKNAQSSGQNTISLTDNAVAMLRDALLARKE